MKTKQFMISAAVCSMMVTLGSCSEEVINNEMSAGEKTSLLRVQTRGDGDVLDGRLYVFNSEGDCLRLFSMDSDTRQVSASLPKGTYDIYAIGGESLSRFNLPEKDAARPTSEMTLKAGQQLGDLMLRHESVTLGDEDIESLDINLERKVFRIERVNITNVPAEVTAVRLSISSLHDGICLNGSYTSSVTQASIILEKDDEDNWQAAPLSYHYPSSGRPVITIVFSTEEGDRNYSYIAESEIPANIKLSIDVTYSREKEMMLTAVFRGADWGGSQTLDFNFTEENLGSDNISETSTPVVGKTYQGYYVAAVDETARKAVLVRKKQDNNIATEEKMTAAFAKLTNKPSGAVGEWRLPTVEECRVFALDAALPFREYDHGYYCMDGETVKTFNIAVVDGVLRHQGFTEGYSADAWFRPVIEIRLQTE